MIKETMQAVSDVIERACGYGGDMVCLAVAMPQSITPYLEKSHEEWEELAMDYGFEYVDSEKKGKNEFGRRQGYTEFGKRSRLGNGRAWQIWTWAATKTASKAVLQQKRRR